MPFDREVGGECQKGIALVMEQHQFLLAKLYRVRPFVRTLNIYGQGMVLVVVCASIERWI